MDAVDRAFVDSLVPEGSVVDGLVAVVSFIDSEGGRRWKTWIDIEVPVTTTLGLLELAKLEVISRSETGLPIRYPDDD